MSTPAVRPQLLHAGSTNSPVTGLTTLLVLPLLDVPDLRTNSFFIMTAALTVLSTDPEPVPYLACCLLTSRGGLGWEDIT